MAKDWLRKNFGLDYILSVRAKVAISTFDFANEQGDILCYRLGHRVYRLTALSESEHSLTGHYLFQQSYAPPVFASHTVAINPLAELYICRKSEGETR
jgi:hypothetical protein